MLQGSAFSALAFSGLALWFGVTMIRRPERRIDTVIFGLVAVYAIVVIGSTMFPIPFEGARPPPATRINLVPFRGLFRPSDISRVQAVPNIALGVPFGFGAFFVLRRATPLQILGFGAVVFIGIEVAQVILTQIAPAAPRTGDINDLMLNTLGVAIGIGLFLGFARIMRRRDEQGELGSSDVLDMIRDVVAPRTS